MATQVSVACHKSRDVLEFTDKCHWLATENYLRNSQFILFQVSYTEKYDEITIHHTHVRMMDRRYETTGMRDTV